MEAIAPHKEIATMAPHVPPPLFLPLPSSSPTLRRHCSCCPPPRPHRTRQTRTHPLRPYAIGWDTALSPMTPRCRSFMWNDHTSLPASWFARAKTLSRGRSFLRAFPRFNSYAASGVACSNNQRASDVTHASCSRCPTICTPTGN